MNKVNLTKEECLALKSALQVCGVSKSDVVHFHSQDLWDGDRKPLNDLDLDTIIRALYVGYEVEKCPEEKVREYYARIYATNSVPFMAIKIQTINEILELLNIKIKGVNS